MVKKNIIIFIAILMVFILVSASYVFGMISVKFALPISFLLLGVMHISLGFFILLKEKNIFKCLQLFFAIILGLVFLILGWGYFEMYR